MSVMQRIWLVAPTSLAMLNCGALPNMVRFVMEGVAADSDMQNIVPTQINKQKNSRSVWSAPACRSFGIKGQSGSKLPHSKRFALKVGIIVAALSKGV